MTRLAMILVASGSVDFCEKPHKKSSKFGTTCKSVSERRAINTSGPSRI